MIRSSNGTNHTISSLGWSNLNGKADFYSICTNGWYTGKYMMTFDTHGAEENIGPKFCEYGDKVEPPSIIPTKKRYPFLNKT